MKTFPLKLDLAAFPHIQKEEKVEVGDGDRPQLFIKLLFCPCSFFTLVSESNLQKTFLLLYYRKVPSINSIQVRREKREKSG